MFSLICVWINGWVNNRGAGDLSCYRAHYDITVMNDIETGITQSLHIKGEYKDVLPAWEISLWR